jgi:hypothetical protein
MTKGGRLTQVPFGMPCRGTTGIGSVVIGARDLRRYTELVTGMVRVVVLRLLRLPEGGLGRWKYGLLSSVVRRYFLNQCTTLLLALRFQ